MAENNGTVSRIPECIAAGEEYNRLSEIASATSDFAITPEGL